MSFQGSQWRGGSEEQPPKPPALKEMETQGGKGEDSGTDRVNVFRKNMGGWREKGKEGDFMPAKGDQGVFL